MNIFRLYESFSGIFWGNLLKFFFKEHGDKLRIIKPLKFINMKGMYFGDYVRINSGGWLQVHDNKGVLKIGSGSTLGHFSHIYAYREIIIGESVLIADKVYISDCLHGYKNVQVPIMHQDLKEIQKVYIGDNSWLGENVVVLGSRIGRHCIIGSNSVVTKDIPDYSIAVGIPARVIKRYNLELQIWEKI